MLRPGALGDVLALRGVLWAHARAFPAARRVVAVAGAVGGLLKHAGCVDHVIDSDRADAAWLFADSDAPPPPALAMAASGTGYGVAYLADSGERVAKRLGRLLTAANPGLPVSAMPRARVWGARPPDGSGRWIYRDLAMPLAERFPGVVRPPELPDEPPPWQENYSGWGSEGGGHASGVWVIHPGSGSRKKNWPWEGFVAVGRELMARGKRVAVSAGEADGELGRLTADGLGAGAEHWEGLSLVELAGRLAGAEGYVGNDSGVSHLAAAAGTARIVVLFGPSDPGVWRPPGRGVRVVHAPGDHWTALTSDRVTAACFA